MDDILAIERMLRNGERLPRELWTKVWTLYCMDGRVMVDERGYHPCNAGNEVTDDLLHRPDVQLLIPKIVLWRIISHPDCAATKGFIGPKGDDEGDEDYLAKIHVHTRARLTGSFDRLTGFRPIADRLERREAIVVAHHITSLDPEQIELVTASVDIPR